MSMVFGGPGSSPCCCPGEEGVTSFNGATGDVGFAPVIPVADVAALAALPTLGALTAGGYTAGQQAFVDATGSVYVLRSKMTPTPDNDWVVATSDDPTRQWGLIQLDQRHGRLVKVTPEIDFTTPQTLVLVPPLTGRFGTSSIIPIGVVSVKNGTVTTGPRLQVGMNATIDDVVASTLQPLLASQAAGTRATIAGSVATTVFTALDVSGGFRVQITAGSVLGTATQHRGRFITELWFW